MIRSPDDGGILASNLAAITLGWVSDAARLPAFGSNQRWAAGPLGRRRSSSAAGLAAPAQAAVTASASQTKTSAVDMTRITAFGIAPESQKMKAAQFVVRTVTYRMSCRFN